MDKLTAIKIKLDEGQYSEQIPISTVAENVVCDNTHSLADVLDEVDESIDSINTRLNSIKEVPSYVPADRNKVLTVNNTGDQAVWKTPSGGGGGGSDLPEFDYHNIGNTLTVCSSNDETVLRWANNKELPEYPQSGDAQRYMLSGTFISSTGSQDRYVPYWVETLPDWEPRDEAKVLTIVQTTSWEDGYHLTWGDALPERNDSDAGKILRVSNTLQEYGWNQNIEYRYPIVYDDYNSMPDYSSSDQGKVLQISNGEPVWDDYSGGGDIPPVESCDVGKILAVNEYQQLVWNYEWVSKVPYGSSGSGFQNGNVLTISDAYNLQFEWKPVLPTYDSSMEGQVLSIASDGSLQWVDISNLIQ